MTTKLDYEGFLAWVKGQAGVSDDAKRIANTVYANFERIERTSSNRGERSRVLTLLLTKNFPGIDPALLYVQIQPKPVGVLFAGRPGARLDVLYECKTV